MGAIGIKIDRPTPRKLHEKGAKTKLALQLFPLMPVD